MKRIMLLCLAALMVCALTACGGKAEEPGSGPYADYWHGDWYGWWIMDECSDEDLENAWTDCCAVIEVRGEKASVTIWDELTSQKDPVCTFSGHFEEGQSENGKLVSDSGMVLGAKKTIGKGDLSLDPAEMATSEFDHLIAIEGHYDDGEDYFDYHFYLRPWGMEWDDVPDDLLPYLYKSWYLGVKDAPMNQASFPEVK